MKCDAFCIVYIETLIEDCNDEYKLGRFKVRAKVEEIIIGNIDSTIIIEGGGLEDSQFEISKRYLVYLYKHPKGYYKSFGEYNRYAKKILQGEYVLWFKKIKPFWWWQNPWSLDTLNVEFVKNRAKKYYNKYKKRNLP